MFWNSEFLNSSPSNIDVLLQLQTVKLSDILFEDDLLQELKTSNVNLVNFLTKPDVIAELVDNITQLTEKDCCDKLVYSRVHVAYISCEILTSGSSEIFTALMNHPECLTKILNCLTIQPKQRPDSNNSPKLVVDETLEDNNEIIKLNISDEENKLNNTDNNTETSSDTSNENDDKQEEDVNKEIDKENNGNEENHGEKELHENGSVELNEVEEKLKEEENIHNKKDEDTKLDNNNVDEKVEDDKEKESNGEINDKHEKDEKVEDNNKDDGDEHGSTTTTTLTLMTKVVPQKATLVSKLISTIHSLAAANLSCHITQDIDSFSKLINLLVNNIEISGSFEILSTFIKRTDPPELRYAFCEILSKLNFVNSLIDVMTLSEVEDKQRNACQLLCDIIVIGRQEALEQNDSGPVAQDMLAEYLELTPAVRVILNQMFQDNNDDRKNSTAIICGMKVLQTLFEHKLPTGAQMIRKTIEQTQEEIEKHLIKFHELLLNPPKQEPIKTTFGIIQKPLGYMRLEVVNLIRALISTNSPYIIKKLVELRTMKVIVDLFIEYCWNNLLHTQVEQALCHIINNYRRDEELNYQIEMNNQQNQQSAIEIPSRALLSQLLNECDLIGRLLLPNSSNNLNNNINNNNNNNNNNSNNNNNNINTNNNNNNNNNNGTSMTTTITTTNNNAQANFGHIIQMINSIAINRDLDTIQEHLNEMKDKRPELYDRWNTFVNVDVASFKEISLYYDAQSATNNVVNHKYGHNQNNQQSMLNNNNQRLNSTQSDDDNDDEDQFFAYFSFTRETVLPAINVDVLTQSRRV